ncbi:hypothetical protein QZH41_003196 [Actinostola sp. cb2023]|nr:hypothetical protein QZH41_003196 [Actinostola sp. cb2023]
MKAYIGMWIVMGINVLPEIAMYWSNDSFIGNDGIKAVMTKNRFEELSQYLHFNDSTQEPPRGDANHDRLYKIRPILSNVLRNIQASYYPGENISIDEVRPNRKDLPLCAKAKLKEPGDLKVRQKGENILFTK